MDALNTYLFDNEIARRQAEVAKAATVAKTARSTRHAPGGAWRRRRQAAR